MFTCLTQILPLFSVTIKRRTRSLQMHTRKMPEDRYSDLGKDLHSSLPQTRLWVRSCMKREPTQPTNQNHHTLLPPPKASTDAHQQRNIGSGNPQETVFIFHLDHPAPFIHLREMPSISAALYAFLGQTPTVSGQIWERSLTRWR